jgi:alpha 1,3-glucosidase
MRSITRPSWQQTPLLCLLVALLLLAGTAVSVKEHDFKKCHQSGFCKRNRAFADDAIAKTSTWTSPYNVIAESLSLKDGQLQATILKTINSEGESARLPITVSFLKSGVARVSVDEEKRQKKEIELRHNSQARKERYNEAEDWVIVGGLNLDKDAHITHQDGSQVSIQYGGDSKHEAVIKFSPFEVEFKRDGVTHVKFNDRGPFSSTPQPIVVVA